MDKMNLHTKLVAYPKVSSLSPTDYVTKEELDTILDDYVTEAPVDSNVYGRKEKEWRALKPGILLTDIILYYGINDLDLQLDNVEEIKALDGKSILGMGETKVDISYEIKESGFFWIAATQPIKSIIWLGMIADYETQSAKIVDGDITYFCYKIREKLVSDQTLNLTINL